MSFLKVPQSNIPAPHPEAVSGSRERTPSYLPFERLRTSSIRAVASALLLAGCGASYEPGDDFEGTEDWTVEEELGTAEQGLAAICGGDDSNALTAALAVAVGNELGRWDVNTDFTITNGKLELSTTGQLHCGTGCSNIKDLIRLQDDVSSAIKNHSPATYRTKLTGWYNSQKTALTNKVDEMLSVDQGVYRIRSKLSGKYIVPQAGSTTNGVRLEQSDQYSSTTAAQWRIVLDGTSRQLKNIKSGLCMDLLTDTASKTNIVQRTCSAAASQYFRLGQLDANVLTLRSRHNQAFAPDGSSSANGAAIVHTTVTGTTPEQFIFEPYGSGVHRNLLETATAVYSLKVAHTGMAMGVSSGSVNDGVTVVQQPYVATDDRFHWYVTQLGTAVVNNVTQTTYQFMNRRTGKCLDLDGSKRMIQRTCSTTNTQRFMLTPTGNLRQVAYTVNGNTFGVQNGSTASGAAIVEGGKTWEMYNMFTFDPILAIEPTRLRFNRKEAGGPCGNYYWYDVTAPNGLAIANPASTFIQLIFAGGKQTQNGADLNPFISQKVNGNQVAIDPTFGLNEATSTSSGACTASCLKISNSNVAGQCCSCAGTSSKFVKASWSSTTYMCK